MATFKCPYCGWYSNKWIVKCPNCGFERTNGGVKVENEDVKRNGGSSRERRKVRDYFKGGRNQAITRGNRKKTRYNRDETIKRLKNRRGYKQN